MKVLCIDDSKEELEKAKKAVEERGHECITVCSSNYPPNAEPWNRTLGKWIDDVMKDVNGVITGLYLNSDPRHHYEPKPPGGLLVVIHAVALNKPVVICAEGSHHKESGWIWDGYLTATPWRSSGRKPFFELEDYKSWKSAVETLEWVIDGSMV